MKNRVVGFLILGIAVLLGYVIFSFNMAMVSIINSACSHGPECPMWGTIDFQTNVSVAIMGFVIIIGLYLVFFGREEKVVFKVKRVHQQIKPKEVSIDNYRKIMDGLGKDERLVFGKIVESKGTIFQSELVQKAGFNKVKVTRILDKLEGKGLLERKRRGMTNVVILRH